MPNTSNFLDLILPGYKEYRESWWSPLNNNFMAIDAWAEATEFELVEARFSSVSLKSFLEVAHNVDGTLKATDEVISSRNSAIYGYQTPEPANFDLNARISQIEWEVFNAREAQANLRANHAIRETNATKIVSGAKDGNGYPTWMSFSGATVYVNGLTTPLMLAIDGKLARVRKLESLTISGGDGTKFIYANYLPDWDDGKIVVDGLAVSPAVPNGTTSLDLGNNPIYFNDATQNFWPMKTAKEFLEGDLLGVIDSVEKGNYVVKEIIESITLGTSNQFSIIGLFPEGGVSSINYRIYDPMRCSLGFGSSESPEEGRIYIGEADFAAGSITAVRARHFGDTFVGEWREVDITTGNGTPNLGTPVQGYYETKFAHNLGSDTLDISIQAKALNGTTVEELTVATLDASTLNVAITDGKTLTKNSTLSFVAPSHGLDSFSPGTGNASFIQGSDNFDPGTSDASFTQGLDSFSPGTSNASFIQGTFVPGSLTGTIDYTLGGSVTGSLTGGVYTDSSVKLKWDKNYVWVKNAVISKFFKDYSGTARQTGYIRVVVRKRG